MHSAEEAAAVFLMRHKMHPDQIDIDKCLSDYIDEMGKGLSGVGSSLLMLPSYIRIDSAAQQEKKVIAVDAGGTNLRIAVICIGDETGCSVESVSKYRMPGSDKPIDKAAFFSTLASYMEPMLSQTDTIVVSFAYPVEIMPNLDGRIIKMVKEIKISNLGGCFLGDELNKTLEARGYAGYKIYVTNDTIATCLAGMSEPDNDAYDSFIGLVLGTGMNTCYLEDIGNIKTKSVRGSGKMLINTESGNFNRQPRGDIDVMLDQATADAGQNTLEKMISGRYFGELIDRIIRFSEKEVLFSSAFYDVYMAMERLDTISFSEFENGSVKSVLNGMPMTRRDKTILHYIFEMMAKRAAKLITVQIAGISVKCGKGRNGGRPICITVEGSTFYRLKYLKKEVERMLRVWLEKDYGIYTKLIHVENAVLKGAAIAGVLSGS